MSMEAIVFEPKEGNIRPDKFSMDIATIGEDTSFSFHNPIESPISDETLKAYVDAITPGGSCITATRPPIDTSSLVRVAEVLFNQTIVKYTGDNITNGGFYSAFIDGTGNAYPTILQHGEDNGVEAWLNIELETTASNSLNRTLRLAPVHEPSGEYERPKVSSGTIEGYVNLGITLEKEDGRNYSNETIIPILEALLTDSELKLKRSIEIQETIPIAEVKNRKSKGLYLKITQPTVERMQKAIESANTLQTYFETYKEDLQRIANAYETATKSDETAVGTDGAFDLYVGGPYNDASDFIQEESQQRPWYQRALSRVVSAFGYSLLEEATTDKLKAHIIRPIKQKADADLQQANVELSSLTFGTTEMIPRELLTYMPQQRD